MIVQEDDFIMGVVYRLVAAGLVITSQCMSPWDIRYTIWPIVGIAVWMVSLKLWKGGALFVVKSDLYWSLLFLGLSIASYTAGLDDALDKWRFFHSMWHVFCSGWAYFWSNSLNPPSLRRRQQAGWKVYRDEVSKRVTAIDDVGVAGVFDLHGIVAPKFTRV
eukprot:CAMPEP_0113848906 /NCGR_PEP_ID=MMETSP0372-20130328/2771_1 /TAXON_ID=340204 /ORGANISM="Lankesteria abbotti" /LENGTH=161 /DNA_ID=CAMNT_0000818509 /DNA_START=299 /DNA_END=781 /DNA_ORIENTATION=- /assembly_acc=CAM_ASM_000359